MSESRLRQAQSAIGHTFADISLLDRALTHASVVEKRVHSNERMEFLGDAVLGLVVCESIYRRYEDQLEGDMTKVKSLAVSRQVCAQLANEIGLTPLLSMGKGMQVANGAIPSSLAAAVFEAVIAAVYLDGGYAAAAAFLHPLVDPLIDRASRSGHQHNFKSLLQQHAQQIGGGSPAYRVLDEKGPDHSKCFKVCVELNGKRYPSSWAPTKKRAEQLAALVTLRELGVLSEEDAAAFEAIESAAPAGDTE